jgi:large subunit ribosomal protein L2
MPIKMYRTNRAARKGMSIVSRQGLHRGKAWKRLRVKKVSTSGRGASGKMTIRHRGGGAKRHIRLVDFGQDKQGVPATVERIEFDPNRSALLALLVYADGERRYTLAWEGAVAGDAVVMGEKVQERAGNRMQLKHITPGASVFNVEVKPGRGGKLFRSAGARATVMDVQEEHALLTLPSGEVRLIPKESYATIGTVSNGDWRLVRFGSAGRMRRLGRRPRVRGKAMNPVDHPHGGGEGLQPIGLTHPKTKWGKPALGVKTRPRGKYSDSLILERRTLHKKS